MRICALVTLLVLNSTPVFAAECELVLQRFVSILTEKGELATDENIYKKKFSRDEFDESCVVTHQGKEYLLYLHPDDVSIVISSKDTTSGKLKFLGPFYSAYKK